jgi:diguanylate cyclase (GGDEF)-like protein
LAGVSADLLGVHADDYARADGLVGGIRAVRSRRGRIALRASAVLGVTSVAFFFAHGSLGLGGHGFDKFYENWLYNALMIGCAVSCLARALFVRHERLPWLLIGVSLVLYTTGEVYYTLTWGDSGTPPVPSVADAFYLSYYPFIYAGLVLMVRARIDKFRLSAWLDGAIAAGAIGAVFGALAYQPIVQSTAHENAATVATTLAYPAGDLVTLCMAVVVFGLAGWRPGRAWVLLGFGLVLFAIADTSYVAANADGTYVVGGILDTLWLAASLLVGFAAWQPTPSREIMRYHGIRLLAIPMLAGAAALTCLIYGGFRDEQPIAIVLAGATVLFVIARAVWTFRENVRLLDRSQYEAVTDALTGLGNRRQMTNDLAAALADGPASQPAVLLLFDLDGFKAYNDHFGHLAGDAMLDHLGRRLKAAVIDVGSAFRLGGDEFCVLLRCDPDDADVHVAAAVAALTAESEDFRVSATFGRVALPAEAHSPTEALRLADSRMYASKRSGRRSSTQQAHDVLLELLREREPDLHGHLEQVGRLAAMVARALGLDPTQVDDVRRAAELHDVGKAAIPEAILNKPAPLNEYEWAFIRRHTNVGERILAAAPSLAPIAPLVRSSHERWDGTGYPDGLAGEAIPLGARIISVCDAFDAMVSDRPYALAMEPEAALAELRRVAGAQFDPRVVAEFTRAWREDASAVTPRAA